MKVSIVLVAVLSTASALTIPQRIWGTNTKPDLSVGSSDGNRLVKRPFPYREPSRRNGAWTDEELGEFIPESKTRYQSSGNPNGRSQHGQSDDLGGDDTESIIAKINAQAQKERQQQKGGTNPGYDSRAAAQADARARYLKQQFEKKQSEQKAANVAKEKAASEERYRKYFGDRKPNSGGQGRG